ncbi:MAG: hypothetical protein LBD94_01555 [Rickettsiales bacterium]|jgi:hypothetical protein|nr:hypothetical protein [Rickettsiales bacterium]
MKNFAAMIIATFYSANACGYSVIKKSYLILRYLRPETGTGGIGGTIIDCNAVSDLCDGSATASDCKLTLTHCNGAMCLWDIDMKCVCKSGYTDTGSSCTSSPCPAGTYGQNMPSGCTSCAAATGNPNATSAYGSTTITNCYVPQSAIMNDGRGTYHFNSNCFWTN